jgi:NAD(P)-dependent dehydrogenase (short-subunit alcohol dehydrogenase family)
VLVERRLPDRIASISSISAWVGGSRQGSLRPHQGRRLVRADLTPEKTRTLEQRIPVGRIGDPPDIADVVAFLCSDDARYVNGAELLADGGMLVNLE